MQGLIGDVRFDGCKKFVCEKDGWIESSARLTNIVKPWPQTPKASNPKAQNTKGPGADTKILWAKILFRLCPFLYFTCCYMLLCR